MRELAGELQELDSQSLYRCLPRAFEGADFSSNDYLGLSQNDEIRQSLIEALSGGCGLGATGSRLLSGNSPEHQRTESFLASAYGAESALLFSTGYAANLSVLSVLNSPETEFFSDALNHASLIDGIRFNRGRKTVFRHNDLNHLEESLRKSDAKRKVIVTESVFSMDGDLAPLPDLISLSQIHGAILVVDEAHATGVFGKTGLGRLELVGHQAPNLISVHTCGKALGAQGAFVLSSRLIREVLINKARAFIFSTALSPLSAIHIEIALRYVQTHPGLGEGLLKRATDLRKQLETFCEIGSSGSQIIPLMQVSAERAVAVSSKLLAAGFNLRAIRYPTVARGSERLRIALNITHSPELTRKLASALREVMAEC